MPSSTLQESQGCQGCQSERSDLSSDTPPPIPLALTILRSAGSRLDQSHPNTWPGLGPTIPWWQLGSGNPGALEVE